MRNSKALIGGSLASAALATAFVLGGLGCTSTSAKKTATPMPTNTSAPTATPVPAATSTPTNIIVGYLVIVGGETTGSALVSTSYVGTVWSNGNLCSWAVASPIATAVDYLAAAAAPASGKIYVATGDNGANAVTSTYVGSVNGSGSITAWTASTPIPGGSSFGSFAKDGAGHFYVVGGYAQKAQSSTVSTAYAGTYGSGAFTSWATAPSLPTPMAEGGLAYANGYLFLLGGTDLTNNTSTVYRATASGGTVGSWSVVTPSIPATHVGQGACFNAAGRIFLVGGQEGASAVQVSSVYSATVDSYGTLGVWTTGANPIPAPIAAAGWVYVPAAFSGYVYVVGGIDGGGSTDTTVYGAPFSGGTLGAWSTTMAFPVAIGDEVAAY